MDLLEINAGTQKFAIDADRTIASEMTSTAFVVALEDKIALRR